MHLGQPRQRLAGYGIVYSGGLGPGVGFVFTTASTESTLLAASEGFYPVNPVTACV